MKSLAARSIVVFFFSSFLLISSYLAYHLKENADTAKKMKQDFFAVNKLQNGLLYAPNWTSQLNVILADKIDSFSISPEAEKVMSAEVSATLYKLLDHADSVLNVKSHSGDKKFRYKVINAFVDARDFSSSVPRFSAIIMNQLKMAKNKQEVKAIVSSKVDEFLKPVNTAGMNATAEIMAPYQQTEVKSFNQYIDSRLDELQAIDRMYTYALLGVLIATMLSWIIVFKIGGNYKIAFLLSVCIAIVTLAVGILLPMIDIDARISELNLEVLQHNIVFYDQVIFFQSKSIFDVVSLLITQGKIDAVIVGILIGTFSILFPIAKLTSSIIFLFRREKTSAFTKFLAFKSGKWSMADVMVVAVFMAFIGFQSILSSQLSKVNHQSENLNMLSTNRTELQNGYLLFTAFVLFGLFLSVILKRIAAKEHLSIDPGKLQLIQNLKLHRKQQKDFN